MQGVHGQAAIAGCQACQPGRSVARAPPPALSPERQGNAQDITHLLSRRAPQHSQAGTHVIQPATRALSVMLCVVLLERQAQGDQVGHAAPSPRHREVVHTNGNCSELHAGRQSNERWLRALKEQRADIRAALALTSEWRQLSRKPLRTSKRLLTQAAERWVH